MKDTDLVDIVKIVDSLKDIKKGDQGEPLRFEDLTPEQIESLTGKQGEDGPRGPVGPRWEFSDLTREQRNELTLKFSHLTEQDKDELRLRFEHLTETQIDELKLKFKHLTKEDKEELRLKFEHLTEANKKEIKGDKGESFKFKDLTKEQKKEIEGKQGDKGDKGDDGLSAYELAKRNGFKGSEAQWLATLKGRDGKDGKSIQVTEQSLKKHKHSTGDITGLEEYVQDVIGNSLVEGTNITIDYDDITGETTINSTGGGGGASSTEITQTGHGFIQTERLYFDETDDTYKKAQSNSESTLGAWHVVEVIDANTFKIAKEGVHEIPNTLDLGEYVLSSTVAGGYTQTLPGDLGDWVLYGMEVLSSTHISFYTVPAIAVGDTGDVIQSVVAGTGITVDNTDPLNPIINATGGGSGTVTSVAISGSDGIEIDSGSPVTTTGTIALGVNKTAMLTHLNVEDGAEVNNISDANATDLTDGNDTTLHTHDGRYYTETEIDTLLSGKVDENISITGATKTKITYDAKGLVTAGADATTADIADSSNKRYVTDADITKIGHITVTQAVDLDQMESDIAALANGMVYKGNWDASAGTFPGGGTAQAGRFYTVSVGGTVDSVVFAVDDRLVATIDNASTTTYTGNWTKLDATDAVTSVFGRLGNVVATNGDYTASQITNVASGGISAVTVQTAIDELDTEKAPKTSPTFATSINGSYLTASEILITDASKNIVSAPVATYPSLIELSYGKGVTSAIQTQLNAKQALNSNLTTIAGLTATTDNFIVSVASAWASRTPSQVRTTLGLIIGTDIQAYSANLTTWASITPGTGVATALGINVGSAGAFVTFNGALGTPSSATLTNATGLPISGLVASTSTALGVGSVELGHASDTTLSRSSAGVLAVEGVVVPTVSSTNTLTNKRITPRVTSETSSATPTINTDNSDIHRVTALAANITSMSTNLSGTPTHGQKLIVEITGTATRTIAWGASFESSTVALPTTTVSTAMLTVGFFWNSATSKWRCVAVA